MNISEKLVKIETLANEIRHELGLPEEKPCGGHLVAGMEIGEEGYTQSWLIQNGRGSVRKSPAGSADTWVKRIGRFEYLVDFGKQLVAVKF